DEFPVAIRQIHVSRRDDFRWMLHVRALALRFQSTASRASAARDIPASYFIAPSILKSASESHRQRVLKVCTAVFTISCSLCVVAIFESARVKIFHRTAVALPCPVKNVAPRPADTPIRVANLRAIMLPPRVDPSVTYNAPNAIAAESIRGKSSHAGSCLKSEFWRPSHKRSAESQPSFCRSGQAGSSPASPATLLTRGSNPA